MPYYGRSAGLTGYLDLARELGFDAYETAADVGVPAAALTDPDLKITSIGISRMYDAAVTRSGVDDFALRIAERRRLQNLGLIGFLAREQSTLRQALKIVAQYVWLQNEVFSLHVEEAEDLAILKFVVAAPIGRQQADLIVGVSLSVMRGLLGDAWRPLDVCFIHAAPANLDAYRRVFGNLPRFEQDFLGLIIRRHELDGPIASVKSAVKQVAQPEPRVALSDKVRDLITLVLPSGDFTLDQIAQRVGMDRRTLHRRLAAEGTSLSEILDLVRCAHAQSLLTNGERSLQGVSDLLGFSSLRAFARWFRRRFNCTASAYQAGQQTPEPAS
jgi:AraC-like DNA-binding protein